MPHVLVIDDDVELCELVAEYLQPEGFRVETVHEGEQGVSRALSGQHDFVVLDVMLPGLGGFEVLRRIRAQSAVPVMMLTARADDIDRIMGLEIGADDYLPKPFNPRELVARIRAIQRRSITPAAESTREIIAVDDLEIDISAREVRCGRRKIELTAVEFGVLEILARSAGKTVTREHLVKMALGRRLTPYDRSIDMHVSNVRRKLGRSLNGEERIKTVRGTGYFYPLAAEAKR